MKLLLDEDKRQFMVTSASDLTAANPDVLDYAQVTGCDLDIEESRHELKKSGSDGRQVSYDPPRYEYSYNFHVTIRVNQPYFDQIRYSLSNGYVKVGERPVPVPAGGWKVRRPATGFSSRLNDYYEYLEMGEEIRRTVENMRAESRQEAQTAAAPKKAVTCPFCGASTVPDEKGCCEYCGSALNDAAN